MTLKNQGKSAALIKENPLSTENLYKKDGLGSSKQTLHNVKYGASKINQDSSSIRINQSSSTFAGDAT